MTIKEKTRVRAKDKISVYQVSFGGVYHGVRATYKDAQKLEAKYLSGELPMKTNHPVTPAISTKINAAARKEMLSSCSKWLRKSWATNGIRTYANDNWILDA